MSCDLAYHMLHTNRDLIIGTEGPIEAHNVGRVAFVKNLQLPHYLVTHGWLDVQHYHL